MKSYETLPLHWLTGESERSKSARAHQRWSRRQAVLERRRSAARNRP